MIHDLKKQGLSNTAIAEQLGISRHTVERRLQRGLEAPVYGQRPPKPRLIEPYEAYLRDRVTAWPDLSGMRLLRRSGNAARLTPPKTLESFDFAFQPSIDRDRIMALAQLDFIERTEVVHFLRPPGTGKVI